MINVKQGMILLGIIVSMGLTSCSDENPWHGSDTEGSVYLNLMSDGRVMRHQTRADDTVSPVVPDISEFGVKLYNSDGSFSQSWNSVEKFNNENSFPIGDYKIEASFGDVDKEGFELPCFKGASDVRVSAQTTTDVEVVATLANAMVSVRYTDAFRDNFQSYSAAVQTPGHDWVVYAQNEDRPAYFSPEGDTPAKLSITMTNDEGKKVTVEPANFVIEPRRHYVVTVNATGNVSSGNLLLDIQFDDEVVNETVVISLGDELFNAPAPEVRAKNFTDKEELSLIEYEELMTDPQFDIFAFAGFSEVNLNVITADYTPSFGAQVNLVGPSDLIQSQLTSEGVEVNGLFKNADKMAVVKMKKFIENLPAGTYKVQLQAKDVMTRLSDPIEFTAKVEALEMELSTVGSADYRAEEITVDVSSNSSRFSNKVTFKVTGAGGNPVDAEIKSITPVTSPSGIATRASLSNTYRYVLGIQPVTVSKIEVSALMGKLSRTASFDVNAPEYTTTVDAFARFAVIKVEGNTDIVKDVMANADIYNGETMIPAGNIKRDAQNNFIIVSGLDAASQYTSLKTVLNGFDHSLSSFTTEACADVNNGAFDSVEETININPINTGFKFGIRFVVTSYTQLKSAIVRSTPQGWANLNALTCNPNSAFMNTWYVVPSTYSENGAVVLRSVGYNHNGPDHEGPTTIATYYSTNHPEDSELNKAAGELFLGSYSLNNRVDGQSWTTRPSTLSFDYSYRANNNEQGEAYIRILSASGAILSEQTVLLSNTASMVRKTVNLNGYPFGEKATKIQLGFKSTKSGVTPAINIPTGSALQEPQINRNNYLVNTPLITTNQYKAVATGSVLTVDNVKLGYSEMPTVRAARRK